MLNLLAGQPADVAVGRLDHGVEVVGVPPVDLAPLQPRQEDAHGLGELAVVWGREPERDRQSPREVSRRTATNFKGEKTEGRRRFTRGGWSSNKV